MDEDTLYSSQDHNAGRASDQADLEATRQAAQRRANTDPKGPVRIYQHVGGRHPKRGPVAATGAYLWRDVQDVEGRELEAPRWFWQAVETILPEQVQ